jgi:hypothetical protein
MGTPFIRKLGGLLMLLAIIVTLALFVTDVPLLTTTTRRFDATGAVAYHIKPTWPLILLAIMFLGGFGLLVASRFRRVAS